MLERMSIKNFAVIDNLTVEFQQGLSAFTGETGAGKSVLIGALGLLLGARSDASMIRTGEDRLTIEGEFSPRHPAVIDVLSKYNIEDNSTLIIRREITREGKNRVFINGAQETLGKLEEIGAFLADMHGQHDHQLLLNKKVHIDILDRYSKILPQVQAFSATYNQLKIAESDEKLLRESADRLKKERDYYQTAVKEIKDADFAEEEEEILEERLAQMQHGEEIFQALSRAHQNIYEAEVNALAFLEDARRSMGSISSYGKKYEELEEIFAQSSAQVKEGARLLADYIDGAGYSPQEMDQVTARIALLKNLKRKYDKQDITALNEFAEECAHLLSKADNLDQELEKAAKHYQEALAKTRQESLALSQSRQQAAKKMSENIQRELSFLGMEKARFFVHITYAKDEQSALEIEGQKLLVTAQGIDRVEFMMSANAGEDPKPLQKIASGGEISRVMLSLKSALAESDPVGTGIFDEIDAGIGGMIAHNVAQKMQEIAKLRQLFTITHLAQIAAKADHHYVVRKNSVDGKTFTEVVLLEGNERVKEIARMLGGEGENFLQLAEDMMNK
ncbi:MAG: DNA repair protein RecN [Brevinema sp.]